MSSSLGDNARVSIGSALAGALCIGLVDTLSGRANALPIWNTTSESIVLAWVVGVWSVIGLMFGLVVFGMHTLFRRDAAQTAEGLLQVVMGKGESLPAAAVVVAAAFGLPPLLEGWVGGLTDGMQLPGMAGTIVTWAVVLVGSYLGHRIVAWWRPSWATGPRVAATFFSIHLYVQLENVAVLTPHMIWPFVWILLASTTVIFASIAQEWAGRVRLVAAAIALVGAGYSLVSYDTRTAEHAAAVQGTKLFEPAVRAVWLTSDFDADGVGWLLDHGDCAPFDADRSCRAAQEYEPPSDVERGAAETSVEHVILITVDSLRADHVGLEVDGKPLTPRIDAFFSGGHQFTNAYSASTHTKEAIPALMLGAQPRHSTGSDRTLAELLQKDWNSAAITGIPAPPRSLVRGFDHFDNSIGEKPGVWSQVTAYEAVFRAVGALKAAREASKPLFLWLHILDPHAYYVSESKYADWLGDDSLKAHYRHEVHRTDDALGQLFLALDDLGYVDNSAIILTSDHGEAFGDHGTFTHVWEGYDAVTKVPLMVRLPDGSGGLHQNVVSLVDIKPTVLELLGNSEFESEYGRSLAPAMQGEQIEPRPAYFHAHYQGRDILLGGVFGDIKVIYNGPSSSWEMYDLSADPDELRNIVSPKKLEPFERQLWGWWYSR